MARSAFVPWYHCGCRQKTLTVQSNGTQQDFVYDLTDNEVKKLTDNSLKSTSLNERLSILNNAISGDFKDKVTMDMLNSKERISITLKPEVEESFRKQLQEDVQVVSDPLENEQHFAPTLNPEQGYANGKDLEAMNERKGWYREGKHGREVEVGDIWVEKVPSKVQQEAKQPQKIKKMTRNSLTV